MAYTNDLIKRVDAMLAVTERIKQIGYDNDPLVLSIRQAIVDVPSEQKTGHWIMKEKVNGGLIGDSVYRYECSECGFSDEHNSSRDVLFCWHCGARMESEL